MVYDASNAEQQDMADMGVSDQSTGRQIRLHLDLRRTASSSICDHILYRILSSAIIAYLGEQAISFPDHIFVALWI